MQDQMSWWRNNPLSRAAFTQKHSFLLKNLTRLRDDLNKADSPELLERFRNLADRKHQIDILNMSHYTFLLQLFLILYCDVGTDNNEVEL